MTDEFKSIEFREKAILAAYDRVCIHYLQDIHIFWVRGNMFLLVELALLAVQSSASKALNIDPLLVSIVGAAFSAAWFSMARVSAEWIAEWRRKVVELDSVVNPLRSYSAEVQKPRSEDYGRRVVIRPNVVGQAIPLIFLPMWIFLLVVDIASL